jgi:hypothetical protein
MSERIMDRPGASTRAEAAGRDGAAATAMGELEDA